MRAHGKEWFRWNSPRSQQRGHIGRKRRPEYPARFELLAGRSSPRSILALLPLGLLVLWLLASLWLISEAQTGWAVFVMSWNGLLVGNLDNVLRPYLITSGISMRMVMVFLGVLGGLLVFGNVGVLLDPRQGLARFNSP
jgi:hypothetical protein